MLTKAGGDQIAGAAQSIKGPRISTHRGAETQKFCQGTGDERRLRVVAEPEAIADAGGNREDILERAAQLDADGLIARINAEAFAPKVPLKFLGAFRDRATENSGGRELA